MARIVFYTLKRSESWRAGTAHTGILSNLLDKRTDLRQTEHIN